MPAKTPILIATILGAISLPFGHGYIQDPPSRMKICGLDTKPDEVQFGNPKTPACSTAFKVNPLAGYNYMAVVTHTWGRSKVTPLPAHVCGFAGETWKGAETPWDVPMQWPATPTSPGPRTFTWNVATGPHFDDTKEFKYWITKAGFTFSTTKALTWDDFETEPFCNLEYDDKNPDANPSVTTDKAKSLFHTKCTLPERSGHHVVYGEWGRTEPTIERFHGCVDMSFGATGIGRKPAGQGARRAQAGRAAAADVLGRLKDGPSGFHPVYRIPLR